MHPPASTPESPPAVHTRVCRALGIRCCRVVGCGSAWFTHVALCGLGSCLSYVCDLCVTVQDCVDTSACCYHKGMFDRSTTDWPSTPLAPQCRFGLRVFDEWRERRWLMLLLCLCLFSPSGCCCCGGCCCCYYCCCCCCLCVSRFLACASSILT